MMMLLRLEHNGDFDEYTLYYGNWMIATQYDLMIGVCNDNPILLNKQACDKLFGQVDVESIAREYVKHCNEIDTVSDFDSFIEGFDECCDLYKDKKFTMDDMLKIAKYAYEFRDTTSFPEHKFEDSCINNTKQYIQGVMTPKNYMMVYVDCEVEMSDGWVPSYGNPDNSGCDAPAEPIRITPKVDENNCVVFENYI